MLASVLRTDWEYSPGPQVADRPVRRLLKQSEEELVVVRDLNKTDLAAYVLRRVKNSQNSKKNVKLLGSEREW